jgi:hypothetical protein
MSPFLTFFRRLFKGGPVSLVESKCERTVLLSFPLVFFLLVPFNQAVQASNAKPFSFALMGDTPYSEEEEERTAQMLESINREPMEFVVHIGDFKNGYSACSDEVFQKRLELFSRSRHPFIYTPGDNEWTDCHRWTNGGYDAVERLSRLRAMFFPDNYSLGQRKLALQRQSMNSRYARYRENCRWQMNGILFVTINVPGSNNNFGRSIESDAEYAERGDANKQWLKEAFEKARTKSMLGLAIFFQANPGFKNIKSLQASNGYRELLTQLVKESQLLRKPVLLAHGDTHRFRVDHPLTNPRTGTAIPNVLRVETFGSPSVNWVRITIDPADPQLFHIRPGS